MQLFRYIRGAWRNAGVLVAMSALYGAAPVAAARGHATWAATRHVQISAFRTSTVAAVDTWVEQFLHELRTVLFLTGSSTIAALRAKPHVTTGATRAWLDQLQY